MDNELQNKKSHPGPLLRRAMQRIHSVHTKVCGEADVSPTQIFALGVIRQKVTLSKRDLGLGIGMELSNVTGLVKRLIDRGYVIETADSKDRRVKNISLTPKAEELVVWMQPKLNEIASEFLAPLSESEAATLLTLLNKVAKEDL